MRTATFLFCSPNVRQNTRTKRKMFAFAVHPLRTWQPEFKHSCSSVTMKSQQRFRSTIAISALSLLLSMPTIATPTDPLAPTKLPRAPEVTLPRDRVRAPFRNRKFALITYKYGRAAEAEMLRRMFVAIGCGAIIGMERRAASASAGVRTLALVSLGASVFTLTALLSLSGDAARMGAAVSTGIGFLGAGAIHQERDQRHLVTAASVWISAALGVAAASGLKFLSLVASLATVAILRWEPLLKFMDSFLERHSPTTRYILGRIFGEPFESNPRS